MSSRSLSTATSVTVANTAYYDALNKCIKLPSHSSEGGAVLEGSIIELDALPTQPGRLLMGEIMEIVIMDKNMTPLVVLNERADSSSSLRREESPPMSSDNSLSREELLQKQREQQQLQFQQYQELTRKHEWEKQQLGALQRERCLSGDSMAQLYLDMEQTHNRETMELQNEHQRAQSEMMDLIFESASSGGNNNKAAAAEPGKNNAAVEWSQAAVVDKAARAQQPPAKSTADRWNRAAVASVAAGTFNQKQRDPAESEQLQATKNTPAKSASAGAANRWNRAAVAAVSAGTFNQTHRAPEETMGGEGEGVEVSYDESQAVSTRASTPLRNNATSREDLEALHRDEIHAVMNDRTLGRKEKKEKLAEIKAKYADKSWNKAAATASAVNVFRRSLTRSKSNEGEMEEQQQTSPPSPASPSSKPSPPSKKWNKAFASALSADKFQVAHKTLKLAEGSKTPMIEFIQKVKSNSPSLTTILLDGREGVSSDEWTELFDALEENNYLTHLSVANCGIVDEVAVSLVLALVENETLISLNLSRNPGLSDSTGKSLLKVLKQSNPVIKVVNIEGTMISPKVSRKIQDIIDDRDDVKRLEKAQEARKKKISQLLAFSASDEVTPTSNRLSQRLLEIEKDAEADIAKSARKSKSVSSHGSDGKSNTSKRTPGKMNRRGSDVSSKDGSGGRRRKSRSSAAAARSQMANLGGSILAGKSMEAVREDRKLRGECETCGQKCFQKTMFKTTPLTIPDAVYEGRCLKCDPM